MLDLYPAIDLKDGRAVRLFKGDMQEVKVYGDALDFAKKFMDLGVKNLHVVDLNGAFEGKPYNFDIIEQMALKTNLHIQVGGGIRSDETIRRYLDSGVDRVILGSVAIRSIDFAIAMAQSYPIAISIDAKNERVAVSGWVEDSGMCAYEFAAKFFDSKIEAIIATDINNDGTLQGLNIDFITKIAKMSGKYTIASGGFASLEDLKACKENPHIAGLIIGKAFYEHKINLQECINLAK